MTASINSNTSEATPRTLVVLDVDGWEAVAVLTLLTETDSNPYRTNADNPTGKKGTPQILFSCALQPQ